MSASCHARLKEFIPPARYLPTVVPSRSRTHFVCFESQSHCSHPSTCCDSRHAPVDVIPLPFVIFLAVLCTYTSPSSLSSTFFIPGRRASCLTAALAVYQISPCHPRPFSYPDYPGPYSLLILEEKIAEFHANNASVRQSLSQLQLTNTQSCWRKANDRGQDGREDHRSRELLPMSQRSGSSRPNVGVTSKDTINNSASQYSRTLPPLNDSNYAEAPRPAVSVPPSPQHALKLSSELQNGARPRPSGPLGMQNLLNPTAGDDNTNTSRRRSDDQFDHPSNTTTTAPNLPAWLVSKTQGNTLLPSFTPPVSAYPVLPGQSGRRILTPRTPSSTMNGPLPGAIGIPSGTIDAKSSPFIASRDRVSTTEPPIPNLPPLSAGVPLADLSYTNPPSTRSPSGYSGSAVSSQVHLKQERRPSGGGLPPQLPASQSNSPSTSYSSCSRFSNTPPAPHAAIATTQPSSFFTQPYADPTSGSCMPRSNSSYGPVSSAAGQNYQLMTLDTDQGPIQVPIDVQAASKVADEKRKRNATASHRFRQRRKEKERETSNNISKLEHQIREIAEEREFYRMERDYFRTVACSRPGQAHAPRPPSPRQVRLAQTSGNGHWQGQDDNGRSGRNTRRRTSSYTPATGLHPPVNPGPPQLPGYRSMPPGPADNGEQRSASGPRGTVTGASLQHSLVDSTNYHRDWKA